MINIRRYFMPHESGSKFYEAVSFLYESRFETVSVVVRRWGKWKNIIRGGEVLVERHPDQYESAADMVKLVRSKQGRGYRTGEDLDGLLAGVIKVGASTCSVTALKGILNEHYKEATESILKTLGIVDGMRTDEFPSASITVSVKPVERVLPIGWGTW